MSPSKGLTAERIEAIKKQPIVYDDDIPEFTDEQLRQFKPAHPEYYTAAAVEKKQIQIGIDSDILAALEAFGAGYQNRINDILRKAVFG